MAHGTTVLLGFLCLLGLSQFILIADGSPESNSGNPDLENSPLFLSNHINQPFEGRRLSKVSQCPGICVNDSYSGFITVGHQHLFFWFFESQKNKSLSPLVVWLNGGPGATSMIGALWENGPVSLVTHIQDSTVKVVRREFNWQNELSILYIDNPVGTGYSFSSDGYRPSNTSEVAETLSNVLQQFYKFFPEYLSRELYIGGQSYAGKYVIALADIIEKTNRHTQSPLPLTGIYLGGPILHPPIQFLANIRMLYLYGSISHEQCRNYEEHIKRMAKNYTLGLHRNIPGDEIAGNLNSLHLSSIVPTYNWYTQENVDLYAIEDYMQQNSTRRALHVGPNLTFVSSNPDVIVAFGGDFFQSWTNELGRLLDKNYKVLVYDGDMDMIVSRKGTEASLVENVHWRGHDEYLRTIPTIWGKWTESSYQLYGFVQKVDNFCRVTLKGAGHQAPRDQPQAALKMITDFIKTGCVEAGNMTNVSRLKHLDGLC